MDERNPVFPEDRSAALVVIEFPSFRDFIDAYSPIISEEGIFIRNEDVSESNAFSVGDRVDFEVRLKDDFRLIQGAGKVAWLGNSDAAGGASGTAIRFVDVDEPSQRLIARLVGNFVRDGGKLFHIDGGAGRSVPAEAADSPLPRSSVELSAESELTAESLGASEADALFADSDQQEAESDPVEFESVTLDDVRGPAVKPQPERETDETRARSEDPVGLDTIAIPSGLVAAMASEAQSGTDLPPLDTDDDEAAELAALPTDVEEGQEPVEEPAIEAQAGSESSEPFESGPEQSLGEEVVPSAEHDEELHSAVPGHAPVGSTDDLEEHELNAEADVLEPSPGSQGGIPDDIAFVAEELSGGHRYEPPTPEEAGASSYVGSASVGSDRNTGGRIAALAVAFVLLGAAAYYFGNDALVMLGLGGDAGGATPVEMLPQGAVMPTPDAVEEAESESVSPGSDVGATEDAAEEAASAAPMDLEGGTGEEPAKSSPREPAVGVESPDGADALAEASAEEAVTAEPATAAESVPAAPVEARRVERITWSEAGGKTVVTIRLNAEISKAYLEVVRVRNGVPREVVKIQGVDVPYSPRETNVGTSHVVRLRTGLHRGDGGSALHVVADLTSADVSILSIEPEGRDLKITFS